MLQQHQWWGRIVPLNWCWLEIRWKPFIKWWRTRSTGYCYSGLKCFTFTEGTLWFYIVASFVCIFSTCLYAISIPFNCQRCCSLKYRKNLKCNAYRIRIPILVTSISVHSALCSACSALVDLDENLRWKIICAPSLVVLAKWVPNSLRNLLITATFSS